MLSEFGLMGNRKFDVMIGGRLINTVYYDADMSAREVRNSLINHDGYSPNISVYRYALDGRYAYDDMARASHPEEI